MCASPTKRRPWPDSGQGTPEDWIERTYIRRPQVWRRPHGPDRCGAFGAPCRGAGSGACRWSGFPSGRRGDQWDRPLLGNFGCADASSNIVPWGILIGGEELHNNHHAFATSAKLSNRWYEFDIGWFYIRILAILGMARVKKVAPTPRLVAPRPVVDLATCRRSSRIVTMSLSRYTKYLGRNLPPGDGWPADRTQFRGLRRWLEVDAREVPADLRARLDALLARSQPLATVYSMREELAEIWSRTNASAEQLVKALQDWW